MKFTETVKHHFSQAISIMVDLFSSLHIIGTRNGLQHLLQQQALYSAKELLRLNADQSARDQQLNLG
jgi:hypothetical protein